MRGLLFALALACPALPAAATTMYEAELTCPVGGEKFTATEIGSYSTWGQLPDGMPVGSGPFPLPLAECPGNGLVLYKRAFSEDEKRRLATIVASPEYRSWRAQETSYYRAYRVALALGDADAPWLLLSATWEAKAAGEASPRARRYNEEFVDVSDAQPAPTTLGGVVLQVRAANALRELGRFEEAERLRANIVLDPALFTGANAAEQRAGWEGALRNLAKPIARHDASRAPIDIIGPREAASRCLAKDIAAKHGEPAPTPLTAFEMDYCRRPELTKDLEELRGNLAS